MSFFDLIQSIKCNVRKESLCQISVAWWWLNVIKFFMPSCLSCVGNISFLKLLSVPLVTQHGLLYMKSKILLQEKEMYDNDIIHSIHVLYG